MPHSCRASETTCERASSLLLILNSVEQYDPTHPSPSVVKKARTFKIVPVHFRVSGTALEIAAEEIKNPRECSAYARNDFNIVDADATWVDDGETGAHGEKVCRQTLAHPTRFSFLTRRTFHNLHQAIPAPTPTPSSHPKYRHLEESWLLLFFRGRRTLGTWSFSSYICRSCWVSHDSFHLSSDAHWDLLPASPRDTSRKSTFFSSHCSQNQTSADYTPRGLFSPAINMLA